MENLPLAYLTGQRDTAQLFAETMPFMRVQEGATVELHLATPLAAEGDAQRARAAIICASCALHQIGVCTSMIEAPVVTNADTGDSEIVARIQAPTGAQIEVGRRLAVVPEPTGDEQYILQDAAKKMGISNGALSDWIGRAGLREVVANQIVESDLRARFLTIQQMEAMAKAHRRGPVAKRGPKEEANCSTYSGDR